MEFSTSDIRQLETDGIGPVRAERQLALLRAGQTWTKLERPCCPGDGIIQFDRRELAVLDRYFEQAIADERLIRFVPASGAASRMFSQLYADRATFEAFRSPHPREDAPGSELALRRFFDSLTQFAFYP
ncbi:MAG: DUF4301 family protein, partial [Desulfuromonadales bacterium]|nr:DUF4301 family protein [Desulfuromonadales bacterium]